MNNQGFHIFRLGVGFNSNPSEKYAQVKLDHFARDENKKHLKPPPMMITY